MTGGAGAKPPSLPTGPVLTVRSGLNITATPPRLDGGGLRFNSDKLRLDLVPASLEAAVAEVLTWAVARPVNPYPERNWERGMKWSTVLASMLRHVHALRKGEWLDAESGKPHVYHIACNAAFLIEYDKTCPHLDDITKRGKA